MKDFGNATNQHSAASCGELTSKSLKKEGRLYVAPLFAHLQPRN
jgi:hypothetical protein